MASCNAQTHAAVMAGAERCGGGDDGGEGDGVDGGGGDDGRDGGGQEAVATAAATAAARVADAAAAWAAERAAALRQCSAARACNADGLGIRHTADSIALTSVAGAGCRR